MLTLFYETAFVNGTTAEQDQEYWYATLFKFQLSTYLYVAPKNLLHLGVEQYAVTIAQG